MVGTTLYIASAAILRDPVRFERAWRAVDGTRRRKTDSLRSENAKRLSLAAGRLLDCAKALCGHEDASLRYTDSGKPYLEGSDLHVSLSHSGDLVLCALSSKPVGCDVERIGALRLALAERRFHPQEVALLHRLASEEEQRLLFYRLWTLKESVLKYRGQGLSGGLSSFAVSFEDGHPALPDAPACRLYEFGIDGYRLAVCAETDVGEPQWLSLE